jgi:5-methylcytosine-specific restriction endonuclease McrA
MGRKQNERIYKKGSIKMTYKEYLDSEEWKMLRQIVIDSQDSQCAHCGRDITKLKG